jgi:hypothetical protein
MTKRREIGMAEIRKYYTNTTGGHNKDYLMIVDFERCTLECHWGPIGKAKTIDRYTTDSEEKIRDLVAEKHDRRIAHGYVENYGSGPVAGRVIDISDLLEAERIGS